METEDHRLRRLRRCDAWSHTSPQSQLGHFFFLLKLVRPWINTAVILAAICVGAFVVAALVVGYPRQATASVHWGGLVHCAADLYPSFRIQTSCSGSSELPTSRMYASAAFYRRRCDMLAPFMCAPLCRSSYQRLFSIRRREDGAVAVVPLRGALFRDACFCVAPCFDMALSVSIGNRRASVHLVMRMTWGNRGSEPLPGS